MPVEVEIEGVLCDLDGTLVDSEEVHLEAWNVLLVRNGYKPEADWNRECIGLPDTHTRDMVLRLYPDMAATGDVLEMKQAIYREMVEAKGRDLGFPGVREKLAELAGSGLKLAVGTNSIRANTEAALKAAGMLDYFSVLVTLDAVKKGKPDPEIYRTAAERLGLAPGRCVVLEDSPAGIASGKAAGCLVIGITNTWPAEKLPDADFHLPDTVSAIAWAMDGKAAHGRQR